MKGERRKQNMVGESDKYASDMEDRVTEQSTVESLLNRP